MYVSFPFLTDKTGSPLTVSIKGLKIRSIDSIQSITGPKDFRDQFLWEGEIPMSLSHTHVLVPETFYKHPRYDDEELSSSPSTSTGYLPDWNFVRYIKLYDDDEDLVLCGLTMFCATNGGIVGLGTHFAASQESGRQKTKSYWTGIEYEGCPIQLRLRPTENITSIWVYSQGDDIFEIPFIAVSDYVRHSPSLPDLLPRSFHANYDSAVLISFYIDTNKRRKILHFRAIRPPRRTWIRSFWQINKPMEESSEYTIMISHNNGYEKTSTVLGRSLLSSQVMKLHPPLPVFHRNV